MKKTHGPNSFSKFSFLDLSNLNTFGTWKEMYNESSA